MVSNDTINSVSDCVAECKAIRYSTVISHGDLKMSDYSRHQYGIPKNYSISSMTSLHFYFPTLDIQRITNRPVSLLREIGKHLILLLSVFFLT